MKYLSIILLFLFMSLSLAQAQYKAGSSMLILNFGFTWATPEDDKYELDGNNFTLCYEASDLGGNWSGGIGIGYMTTSADSINSSGSTVSRLNAVNYEVVPVFLYGRYMFGSDQIKGYIGGGGGIQFSTADFFRESVQLEAKDSGLMIGGMAGVNYFINDKILINGNYNLSWLQNAYYKDGLVQNFTIGLGYQFF